MREVLIVVSNIIMIANLKLVDIMMLIMLEIMIHVGQLVIMCSNWVLASVIVKYGSSIEHWR